MMKQLANMYCQLLNDRNTCFDSNKICNAIQRWEFYLEKTKSLPDINLVVAFACNKSKLLHYKDVLISEKSCI